MRLRRILPLAASVLLLAACTSPLGPRPAPAPDGRVVEDVDFGGPPGILLDVCLPPDALRDDAPAVLSVHGGGWTRGDKAQAQWRESCAWLAGEGFVVFQTNYRLAPEHVFPAALEDVGTALAWLREPAQARRFGHDVERIAGFGDSAGGNLVALLATRAEGADLRGVVELSAPIDLTAGGALLGSLGEGFQQLQLDYLGCADRTACPAAAEASPNRHLDAGDPPFLIVHSVDDFIPIEQAEAFASDLSAVGVPAELVRVGGSEHALGMLDDAGEGSGAGELRQRIAQWLRERLEHD